MVLHAAAAAANLSAPGIKKAGESILNDLYQIAKRQGRKWKAKKHAESLAKRVKQLRLVKTIWQSEKEVDLTKFYYPSKVWIENERVEVHQLAALRCDANVLIQGTVGQGKSIFLRYLAFVEFCLSRRIPVFVELRKVREDLSVQSLILQELKTLGFDVDEDLLDWMASEGAIVLFLDAFDEVKNDLRASTLTAIEELARRHDSLRIVVSSRPDTGASHSPALRVFNLCPLVDREYETVIQKMTHDERTAKAIIDGVRRDSLQVVPLLTTPLMVALLMIRYRIDQTLPNNIAAFYESLFILLLQRHDKTKGGYSRPRKSTLSDSDLEMFFNALAFLTSKANETSFSRGDLNRYGAESLRLAGLNANVDHVLTDIIDVTCLILAEGEERRFIHKSVQEYHAALFIKDQPDSTVISFYRAMQTNWRGWTQQLEFLAIIDRYRFNKFFYIPQLRSFLACDTGIPSTVSLTRKQLSDRCGRDQLTMRLSNGEDRSFMFASTGHFWPTARRIRDTRYPMQFFNMQFAEAERLEFQASGPGFVAVTVNELLNTEKYAKSVEAACLNFLQELIPELEAAEKFVAQVDQRKSAFAFGDVLDNSAGAGASLN